MSQILSGYRYRKNVIVKGMWPVKIYGVVVGTKLMKYLMKCIQGGRIFEYWMDEKKKQDLTT